MKFQHLNLTNRCVIEKHLAFQSSFREIAAIIGCSPSTVTREVRNNREFISSAHTVCINYTSCLQRKLCGSSACFAPCKTCHSRCCHDLCKQFVPQRCKLLDKAPYVCTGCTKQDYLADICVCYFNSSNDRSGTGQTVRMVQRKGIPIINLF